MGNLPRTLVLLGVLGVVALVAIYTYTAGSSEEIAQPSNVVTLHGICLSCQKPVVATYDGTKSREPAVCPECGERAVYGTAVCLQCNIRFVPELEPAPDGGPPRRQMMTECPECGNRGTQGYVHVDPQHQQAELGPLPEWPQ